MNKKRPGEESSEASPRSKQKYCLVEKFFVSVRNNVALVTLIYSFLPIQDLVQLGQLDKQFYADEHRGQVVGVYGDDRLDTEAALDKVRRYVEYESTLDALSAFGNTPDCWQWVDECGEAEWVADQLQDSWFDKELGWDLSAIQEHADFEEVEEEAMEGLESVNEYHRESKKKLAILSVYVKKLGCTVGSLQLSL